MYPQLANLVSIIKSSMHSRLLSCTVESTFYNYKILYLLHMNGAIRSFGIAFTGDKRITVYLKYKSSKPFISSMFLVSKPSYKVYWSISKMQKLMLKNTPGGFYIISTSNGLQTTGDNFGKTAGNPTGGEILLRVNF